MNNLEKLKSAINQVIEVEKEYNNSHDKTSDLFETINEKLKNKPVYVFKNIEQEEYSHISKKVGVIKEVIVYKGALAITLKGNSFKGIPISFSALKLLIPGEEAENIVPFVSPRSVKEDFISLDVNKYQTTLLTDYVKDDLEAIQNELKQASLIQDFFNKDITKSISKLVKQLMLDEEIIITKNGQMGKIIGHSIDFAFDHFVFELRPSSEGYDPFGPTITVNINECSIKEDGEVIALRRAS